MTIYSDDIEITGLDRAAVLAALCNGTSPLGLGMLNAAATIRITPELAREYLAVGDCYVDYVFGRPIKVEFKDIEGRQYLLGTRLYDRDAGQGAAEAVIAKLRKETA